MIKKTQIYIKRLDFNSLNDKVLGWTCIEPTIQKIQGKNISIKSQVYAQLTSGQKSLLLFWILYGHTRNGIIQFFDEVDYFLVNIDIWIEFKDKFKTLYFLYVTKSDRLPGLLIGFQKAELLFFKIKLSMVIR